MMFSWSDYVYAVATTNKIPSDCGKLRVVQLAQAILESARGTSQLFQKAGNPGGLKWRDHIDDNYSEKITDKVWLCTPSQPNGCYWCQWKTAEHAAMGYWRFIDRPNSPYQGWKQHLNHPEGYLQHIWEKGYATDPNYLSKVKGLFQEAQSLLDQYSRSQLNHLTALIVINQALDHQGDTWLEISSPCSGWVFKALTSEVISPYHPASDSNSNLNPMGYRLVNRC